MSIQLRMPALSPTMEKGTLARWLVCVGDIVMPGDVLAEIETDKATMEFEAIDEGRIAAILVCDGTHDVPVGTVLALMVAKSLQADTSPNMVADIASIMPALEAEPRPAAPPPAPLAANVSGDFIPAASALANDASIDATPLARKIAGTTGQILRGLTGSGIGGRIMKADLVPVSRVHARSTAVPCGPARSTSTAVYPPPAGAPHKVIKLTGMPKANVWRLDEPSLSAPHFYLSVHCNLDPLLKLRDELNASLARRGIRLSVNDLAIKAMALAMQREPDTNVQFAGEEMYVFDRVDISMAVAIEGGLIAPIIRDVGTLSVAAIAEQSKALARKAREGILQPEEYQGGTASISNLGRFGIDMMLPVIHPPQAVILGVGSGAERPWKVEGSVGLATVVTATASFDHRAIDGVVAARFMGALREIIETPWMLIA